MNFYCIDSWNFLKMYKENTLIVFKDVIFSGSTLVQVSFEYNVTYLKLDLQIRNDFEN